jgi:hypothetical protein
VNKFRVLLILLLFLLLCILPIASAADEIHITYDQVKIDEGEFRYWYGKGVLSAEVSENFCMDIGDAEIIAFTGAIPIKKEGNKVDFITTNDKFESAFLASVPEGHGLYTVSFTLPAISGREDGGVIIKIENGGKIINSNVDFDSHKEGEYLVLDAKTNERDLNFRYISKLVYLLFANMLAGGCFILILLGYVTLRRKKIKEKLSMKISDTRRKIKSPIGSKEKEGGYEISLDFGFLKRFREAFRYKEKKLSFKMPFWLVSGVIIAVLLLLFFFSLKSPLENVWDSLGMFKMFIVLAAILFAVLSVLLLLSADDYKSLSLRFGVVGGGIVGAMFGYLGLFAVILAVTTCLLIYLLSVFLLEEEEQ